MRALIEVVFRNGLGVGGIEFGELVEVVGEGFLDDLVSSCSVVAHAEFGLGWSPGRMGQGGRDGLTDVGEDLGDGLGIGEGPERSGDRRRGVGVGAVRGGNAMNVRGVWQVGQTSGKTS